MAKKRAKKDEGLASPMRPPDSPRFSVSFHADGDSMEDLHRKMGKAFGRKGGSPKDEAAEHRAERGGRGRRIMKRGGKKKMGRRR